MRNFIYAPSILSCVALLTNASAVAGEGDKCGLTRYASLDLVTVEDQVQATAKITPFQVGGLQFKSADFPVLP
jgi:hypothetical protein